MLHKIDPYNCMTDPCHLAWIVRDHPNYFEMIRGEDLMCENGVPMKELAKSNKDFFKRCDRDEL